jgi:hypothetical protein
MNTAVSMLYFPEKKNSLCMLGAFEFFVLGSSAQPIKVCCAIRLSNTWHRNKVVSQHSMCCALTDQQPVIGLNVCSLCENVLME